MKLIICFLFISNVYATDKDSYYQGCYDAMIENFEAENSKSSNGKSRYVFTFQKRQAEAKCKIKASEKQ